MFNAVLMSPNCIGRSVFAFLFLRAWQGATLPRSLLLTYACLGATSTRVYNVSKHRHRWFKRRMQGLRSFRSVVPPPPRSATLVFD